MQWKTETYLVWGKNLRVCSFLDHPSARARIICRWDKLCCRRYPDMKNAPCLLRCSVSLTRMMLLTSDKGGEGLRMEWVRSGRAKVYEMDKLHEIKFYPKSSHSVRLFLYINSEATEITLNCWNWLLGDNHQFPFPFNLVMLYEKNYFFLSVFPPDKLSSDDFPSETSDDLQFPFRMIAEPRGNCCNQEYIPLVKLSK